MRTLILFCLLPVLALAQITLQATGQTVLFTLTAGAKAGWNNGGVSVENAVTAPVLNAFRIHAVGNRLWVQSGTKGVVRLVNIRGRVATTLVVDHDGFTSLPRGLANGVYAARFDAPGMTSKTARLAVVR